MVSEFFPCWFDKILWQKQPKEEKGLPGLAVLRRSSPSWWERHDNRLVRKVCCLVLYTLIHARVIWEENINCENALTRLACEQAHGTFYELMIDVGGPSPLWAVLGVYKKAN